MILKRNNDFPSIPDILTEEKLDELLAFITSKAKELDKRAQNTKNPNKLKNNARQILDLTNYSAELFEKANQQIKKRERTQMSTISSTLRLENLMSKPLRDITTQMNLLRDAMRGIQSENLSDSLARATAGSDAIVQSMAITENAIREVANATELEAQAITATEDALQRIEGYHPHKASKNIIRTEP